MTSKKTHPSVQQFKDFVRKHPKLILEVRKGNKDWQEVFEDWYLLGENDLMWQQYKEEQSSDTKDKETTSKVDFMNQLFTAVKKMDMDTVNHHLTNMSSTISTLQGLFDQFGSKGIGQSSSSSSQHPFSFRKD